MSTENKVKLKRIYDSRITLLSSVKDLEQSHIPILKQAIRDGEMTKDKTHRHNSKQRVESVDFV